MENGVWEIKIFAATDDSIQLCFSLSKQHEKKNLNLHRLPNLKTFIKIQQKFVIRFLTWGGLSVT